MQKPVTQLFQRLRLDALAGYDDETRALYSGGLSDELGPEEPMVEAE